MSHEPITSEERFAMIVEELLYNPDVTPPSHKKGFGESALKIHNKIFAILVKGKLVVKLPTSFEQHNLFMRIIAFPYNASSPLLLLSGVLPA